MGSAVLHSGSYAFYDAIKELESEFTLYDFHIVMERLIKDKDIYKFVVDDSNVRTQFLLTLFEEGYLDTKFKEVLSGISRQYFVSSGCVVFALLTMDSIEEDISCLFLNSHSGASESALIKMANTRGIPTIMARNTIGTNLAPYKNTIWNLDKSKYFLCGSDYSSDLLNNYGVDGKIIKTGIPYLDK